MKIAIIGYSSSGKSTLAKHIAEKYSLPLQHLDKVYWGEGWEPRKEEEAYSIAESFLQSNDSWVIDGNYSKLLRKQRLEEADKIIFLNLGRFTCLRRAYNRYRTNKGKSRDSITEGCPEKFDLDYIEWVLFKGRTWRAKASFNRVLNSYPDKTIVINNQKELDDLYNNLDSLFSGV